MSNLKSLSCRLALLFLVVCFSVTDVAAQFTIEDESDAKSIKSEPKIELTDKYDIEVVNEALLKKQKRDEFNRKNYIEVNAGLTVSQSSFTNWAAGGNNAFTGRTSLYVRHVYREKKFNNDAYINMAYGLGENSDKLWKTEDRLEINNSFGYKMYKKWDYSANINFLSQFANGYGSINDPLPISHFLAPAKINVSLGLSYTRNAKCKISLMPISGNIVIVNDQRLADLGMYGVEPGSKTKTNIGAYANIIWEEPIIKNLLTYRTLASSFTNYKDIPNLNWQSWITIQAMKYLKVELYMNVIYDDKIVTPDGGKWQFSQTLGVGLSYTFKNRAKL